MSWAIWRVLSKYDRCRNVIFSFIFQLKNGKMPCVIIVSHFALRGEHICNYFKSQRPTIDNKKKLKNLFRKQWILMNTLKCKSFKFRTDPETLEQILLIGQLFDRSTQTILVNILAATCFIRKKPKTECKIFLLCTIGRQRCNSI